MSRTVYEIFVYVPAIKRKGFLAWAVRVPGFNVITYYQDWVQDNNGDLVIYCNNRVVAQYPRGSYSGYSVGHVPRDYDTLVYQDGVIDYQGRMKFVEAMEGQCQ